MLIRAATPEDFALIHALVVEAFGRDAEAGLVEALRRDNDAVIDIVADDIGPIVGHAMFSKVAAPFPALGLAPVAVAAPARNKGVASTLIRYGLDEAARAGWRGVFVLGDPAFYSRFGFDGALANGFDSLYSGPNFLALPLGGTPPVTKGAVDYAPAFAALD